MFDVIALGECKNESEAAITCDLRPDLNAGEGSADPACVLIGLNLALQCPIGH
jgi:hypothetical protein